MRQSDSALVSPEDAPASSLETIDSAGKVFRRLMKRNRYHLYVGTLGSLVHQCAEAAVPVFIGLMIDHAVVPGSIPGLFGYLVGLAALFIVLTASYRYGARVLVRGMNNEEHLLRMEVAQRVFSPRGMENAVSPGDLITITTSDMEYVAAFFHYFSEVCASVVAIIAAVIILCYIYIPLGLAVVIVVPLVVGLIQLLTPWVTSHVLEQQETIAAAADKADDYVLGLRVLQGFGGHTQAIQRYNQASQKSLRAACSAAVIQSLHRGASAGLGACIAAAVAITGAYFVLHDGLTVGSFVIVIGLAQYLVEPFRILAVTPSECAAVKASATRVADVLNTKPIYPEPAGKLPVVPGNFEISGLHYKDIFTDVNLTAPPGKIIGLMCLSQTDADALVEIISGHIPPSEYDGSITYGGIEIRDIVPGARSGYVLVEPHTTTLFSGTITSNVLLGKDADESQIQAAIAASGAQEMIQRLPGGLDHEVIERGNEFSGGQKQRLALARALLLAPQVLVLVAPTTAVDSVTEASIAEGIAAMRRHEDMITLIITASPALLNSADEVIVIGAGKIMVRDTHAALVAGVEQYREAVTR